MYACMYMYIYIWLSICGTHVFEKDKYTPSTPSTYHLSDSLHCDVMRSVSLDQQLSALLWGTKWDQVSTVMH